MSDETYFALRKFLNQFPRDFLETDSGVEIKILKKLFTEEEAGLTIQLSTAPEELHKIAERLDWKADDSGLIHAGANSKHLSNICNCCPCCCAGLKALTQKGSYRERHFNPIFEPEIDVDECIACEACVERCPVGAIVVEDMAKVDRDKCLGCGLCAGPCPVEAIRMIVRKDVQHPFNSVADLGDAVIRAKGKEPLTIR